MSKIRVKAERVGNLFRISAGEFHAEFPKSDASRNTISTAAKTLLELAAGFSAHDVHMAVFDLQMREL